MFGIKELQRKVKYLSNAVSDLELENHKLRQSINDLKKLSCISGIEVDSKKENSFTLKEVMEALLLNLNLDLLKSPETLSLQKRKM